MSNITIQPNASGTGTFSIASPNSNTSRTLTLPDTTGVLLNDASSLASGKLTGALPAIDGSALTGVGSTTYGAVGTYVGGYVNAGAGVFVDNNDTTAGSNILKYDGSSSGGNNFNAGNQIATATSSAGLVGTWRCMAAFEQNVTSYLFGSLFLRIS